MPEKTEEAMNRFCPDQTVGHLADGSVAWRLCLLPMAAVVVIPTTLALGLWAVKDPAAGSIIALVYLPAFASALGGFILLRARKAKRTGRLVMGEKVYVRDDDPRLFRSVLVFHTLGAVFCFGAEFFAFCMMLLKTCA